MPQLDTTTFPSQIFWLVICFFTLYVILSYVLVPKITAILDNRETMRKEKIDRASTYREEAENLLVEYEKLLAQTRKEAHEKYQSVVTITGREMNERKKAMLDQLQERLHIAEQDLYRARMEASVDMHSMAQEIAGEILQKLTGQTYTPEQLNTHKDKA